MLAAPAIYTRGAFAADEISVADVGGAPGEAIKKAFYEPFEKQTGIKVVGVQLREESGHFYGRFG